MVPIGTSLAIPLITNSVIPTGGEIIATCIILTTKTPNHILSKPKFIIIGVKMGMVSNIMDASSIAVPRNIYVPMIIHTTAIGGNPKPVIIFDNAVGIFVTVMK